ncbi:uncharacterized protein N7518_003033 [Penicillium psychrosexuale]|uniref:uncharacterized protein n=1 Tax=Penicillium psychrosexuale TaxID=1002107 RepID=UPI002545AE28|nr:uncharacterized protein N7518_003033 [Penicillium psychrosexuale]KAJ5800965.1 hypothetical protein N7518_003033 [Penicillium psychrosexuale]
MADVFNRECKFRRNMNQKEAFKQLSHQFHTKGTGNMKTEKRLKQIDEERSESMSTLESSQNTSMNTAAHFDAFFFFLLNGQIPNLRYLVY